MIKYTSLPDRRITIATLKGTKYDALMRINKLIDGADVYADKYLMPDKFKVVLYCDERDEFNISEGKKIAKKKLMKNYYRSLDKRMNLFLSDVQKLSKKMEENLKKGIDNDITQ